MGREQEHRRAQLDLRGSGIDAGHELQDVVVRARGGNRLEQVAVDDRLAACALHVDNGRLAAHRDRFFQRADAQLDVDRRGQRPGQLDRFTFDCVETG